jgi:hypothetical protein
MILRRESPFLYSGPLPPDLRPVHLMRESTVDARRPTIGPSGKFVVAGTFGSGATEMMVGRKLLLDDTLPTN